MYHARPPPPGNRLQDLLDQVRQEFDGQANRASEHEHARELAQSRSDVTKQ